MPRLLGLYYDILGDAESQLQHVDQIFSSLDGANETIKLNKYAFVTQKVRNIGHLI